MNNSLYREEILDHYHHPWNFSKPAKYTYSTKLNNPLCGDSLTAYLVLEKDKVKHIYFQGEGCAISIASASLLSEKLKGWKIAELIKLKAKKVLQILNLELTPARLKCALLPLEVIQQTLLEH